ncbi:hypothetical protein, partial [Frankia sp. AvcI1]|uniref:hypothetical protein n=1 Tax=Frankia sp. AvcI1 TaxID=573496 RepID=UPI0035B30CB2
VTSSVVADRVAQAGFSGRMILVDDPDSWPEVNPDTDTDSGSFADTNVGGGSGCGAEVGLGSAAYVVFTSGSTGRPKGV